MNKIAIREFPLMNHIEVQVNDKLVSFYKGTQKSDAVELAINIQRAFEHVGIMVTRETVVQR